MKNEQYFPLPFFLSFLSFLLAGYCVIIGNCHLDNLLLTETSNLWIHIDWLHTNILTVTLHVNVAMPFLAHRCYCDCKVTLLSFHWLLPRYFSRIEQIVYKINTSHANLTEARDQWMTYLS